MKNILRVPLALVALLRVLLPLVSAQSAPSFTNATVHDPAVLQSGTQWHLVGSHLATASAPDLLRWTQGATDWNASTNPTSSLVAGGNPLTQFADAFNYVRLPSDTAPATFWGCDWIRLPSGKFALYYAVCAGTSRAALGLATSDAITGPYTDAGVFLRSGMWGQTSPDGKIYDNTIHPNAVDPAPFYDANGQLWLVYGSFSGGIFILQLDSTTGLPRAGQAYGTRLTGGNHAPIEGAAITYRAETGYYYLFCTFGQLDSTGGYNIRVARSRTPDGPYLDSTGRDVRAAAGAPGTLFDQASISPYFVKLMGNFRTIALASDPKNTTHGYVSPGGVSLARDARGRHLLVFHTRFVGRGELHEVRVHQWFLNADDWPVVSPQRFADESATAITAATVPGTYKLIAHGRDTTATVKTAVAATFTTDASVSGEFRGTWQLVGDNQFNLTLNDVAYRGVIVPAWDEDNEVWTTAFTALSADGAALWGSRSANATGAPLITTQPASLTVAAGASAQFTVTASGNSPLSYLWRKDGQALPTATNATLTLSNTTAADAGSYSVIVSNPAGSTTSQSATLSVTSPSSPVPPAGGGGGGGGAPSLGSCIVLLLAIAFRRMHRA